MDVSEIQTIEHDVLIVGAGAEFHERHGNQEAWKAAVLAGEIELEDIDTEPFNFAARGKPTLKSSKDGRNMISGVTGRPQAESV